MQARAVTLALLFGAAVAVAVSAMPIADELAAAGQPEDDGQIHLSVWCNGAGALSPECGGFIGGIVWFGDRNNCSFVLLDNETDKTKVVAPVTVCADHRSGASGSGEGFTAFDNPTKQILFVTGDGAYVWGVSVNNGKATQLAALPPSYPPVLALAVANGVGANGAWYVVTADDLLQITPASGSGGSGGSVETVMDLSSLGLTADARVACYNTTLYVVDQSRAYVIDLLQLTVTATVGIDYPALSTTQTLLFWPTNNTLVTVTAERQVVQIDFAGRVYPIMTLPVGSGAVSRSTNFFDMFFATDDAQMYLVNLSAKKLETAAAWPGANTESSIQYYF